MIGRAPAQHIQPSVSAAQRLSGSAAQRLSGSAAQRLSGPTRPDRSNPSALTHKKKAAPDGTALSSYRSASIRNRCDTVRCR
ncbi:hypothetical protein DTL00_07680 [Sphingomonas melonis]